MPITFTPTEDARDDIGHALRFHSEGMSAEARQYFERAHSTLVDLTRAGNLSPDYLLRQDQARRESEAPTRQHISANGWTAA